MESMSLNSTTTGITDKKSDVTAQQEPDMKEKIRNEFFQNEMGFSIVIEKIIETYKKKE